ncbi:hypothetical protein AX15_007912, partial [Amanita polypyramis BW_CC]
MAPITLPELSNYGYVNLPIQPPSDPPNPRDVARSEILCHDVVKALERGNNTMGDLSSAVIYRSRVVTAATQVGDEPAWLGQALANMERALGPVIERALTPLRNDIATMKNDITTMKSDITTMKNDITTLKND